MANIEITRGMLQVLFRYLPEEWIDYYDGNAVAKVAEWDSRKLEGISAERLLERVDESASAFPELRRMQLPVRRDEYEVLYPKRVIVQLAPLVFVCRSCGRAYSFKSAEQMRKHLGPRFRCQCGGSLRQMELVYACPCGWTGPAKPHPCPEHGWDGIVYVTKHRAAIGEWMCSKCGKAFSLGGKCPDCGRLLNPRPFRQSDVYIPRTLGMVDLLDRYADLELRNDAVPVLVNAWWLGLASEDEMRQLAHQLSSGNASGTEDGSEKQIRETADLMVCEAGLDPANAERLARAIVEKNSPHRRFTQVASELRKMIHDTPQTYRSAALSVLEFNSLLQRSNNVDLVQAADRARQFGLPVDASRYQETAKLFGFDRVLACSEVPMLFCSFGYTRGVYGPEPGVLRGFPEDRELKGTGKRAVYAARLETEGILLEFNRHRILEWLTANGFAEPERDYVPAAGAGEAATKAWFLKNIRPREIPICRRVPDSEQLTKHVYTLLHSAAHVLIKAASELSGLERDSLSEYIFPGIPAVLIYCHNAQGFKLGALLNLFEAFFDVWLEKALDEARTCIYDPICADSKAAACIGCLFINEVSCQHFNLDLDRRYLIGCPDEGRKMLGYWEHIG